MRWNLKAKKGICFLGCAQLLHDDIWFKAYNTYFQMHFNNYLNLSLNYMYKYLPA